jgi:hypothetical protein
MRLRYALSQLRHPAARRAFGRTWLWVCAAGALATVAVVGPAHVFFTAVVWLVCVFAPVRIAIEVFHSRGPRMRQELHQAIAGREDRYATPEGVTLMVETLFAREVRLPRLAPPDLREKVIEAASRISHSALRGSAGPSAVLRAATTCAALLQRWTEAIAAGEAAHGAPATAANPLPEGNGAAPPSLWDPTASIQEQWVALRALAGLAALAKTLTAVYEDSAGGSFDRGPSFRALAEAAMDYVDQVGLRLDGPAWEEAESMSPETLPPDRVGRLADAWVTFCAAPPPAPRRLRAFVETLRD